jgi:hypothetical protein
LADNTGAIGRNKAKGGQLGGGASHDGEGAVDDDAGGLGRHGEAAVPVAVKVDGTAGQVAIICHTCSRSN